MVVNEFFSCSIDWNLIEICYKDVIDDNLPLHGVKAYSLFD